MAELEHLLAACRGRAPREIMPGLGRMAPLLARLGHPERAAPVVQVAGTNGKGSTIAFLDAMLTAAGYRVGCYFSPALQRINDTVRLGGEEIHDADLAHALAATLDALGEGEATPFELFTAAAFLHFAWHTPDWLLVECGMGGGGDATSVVTPRLCLITPIGLDHQAYLGGNLTAIAEEKAGILKPGAVAACAATGEAEAAVVARAALVGTPLWRQGREYQGTRGPYGGLVYEDGDGELLLPRPGLAGAHQYQNAALALAGVRLLRRQGTTLDGPALATGVRGVRWPGRLERVGERLWLDGAHNPDGARALAAALRPLAPVELIFGAMADKDVAGMIAALAPVAARVWTVAVGGTRGRSAAELAALWSGAGVAAEACASAGEALARADSGTLVMVTGSLHLVGEVKNLL